MDTIFNKNSEGVDEMRKYFSHISGTIEYPEIEPDVVAAQDEVVRYLGTELVQKAIRHYQSENFKKPKDESQAADELAILKKLDTLTELTQNAVALWAYRDFARNKDVTHTGTGRVARMDKAQDEVNLRLIDADDLALLQKALKAMDRLIRFVDNEQFDEWKNSIQYKETRELLIWNADLFEKYYPIERNRRIFLLLAPMIRKIQIDRILPRLGKEGYDALLAKVKAMASDSLDSSEYSGSGAGSGTALSADDQHLYDLVCYPITEFAMSEAYLKLPVQLFPESMARQFWNAGNGSAALTMLEKISADIEQKGIESLARLEAELRLREAQSAGEPITDDAIVDIAERMDAGNLFVRV